MLSKNKENEALLSKYYSINGNVAEVTLVYDTFSELVDPNFGDDKVEKLSNKLFDSINLVLKEIPIKYSISLNIKIKDFGSYNSAEAIKIIRENIEMRLHTINRAYNKQRAISVVMILIGILIITASRFLPSMDFMQLGYEIVDLFGCVFAWEGAYSLFLEKPEERQLSKQYQRKLTNIHISQYNEPTLNVNIQLKKDKGNLPKSK